MAGTKQFDPEQALQSAVEVFRNKGFAATSMQDLERAMGLGRGSIYNTFGDKQALFLSAVEKYHQEKQAHLAEILRDAPRAIDGIRFAVRNAAVEFCSSESHPGCLIGNTAVERAIHDGDSAQLIERCMDQGIALMSEALIRAQNEGDFAKSRDPGVTARFILLGVQGLAVMAKATSDAKMVRLVAEEILRSLD